MNLRRCLAFAVFSAFLAASAGAAITNTGECGSTQDQGTSMNLSGCPVVSGDTGIVLVTLREDSPIRTVSSVSDGSSTWVFRGAVTNGTIRTELWSTAVNGVATTTGPTVTLSGAACGSWAAIVATYDGVLGLGIIATNSGNSAAPTISITTQDSNNFIVGQLGSVAVTTGVTNGNLLGNSEKTDGTSPCVTVREATLDNNSGSPSTLTLSISSSSSDVWSAAAIELRSIEVTATATATATTASSSTFTATATVSATATATVTATSTATATQTATATATARSRCYSLNMTPVRIETPDPLCSLITIANLGPLELELGDHTVTSATRGPVPLQPNDLLLLRRDEFIRDDWWAVVMSGTGTVCITCSLR